jgi:endonuclease YncB( thermonuclease family)
MRRTPWTYRRRIRNPWGAIATLVAIGLLTALVALFWPPPASLSGQARAVDGDTLRMGESRIRLIGLDAVELDQTCTNSGGAQWACGREARSFLDRLSEDSVTTCAAEGHDRYRRVLARCRANDADIGEQIVRAGWAVAELEYGVALAEARLNGRGIWAGRFDDPADWRRNHGAETFDFWAWLMGLFGR